MGLMDDIKAIARAGFAITDTATATLIELSSDVSTFDDDLLAMVPITSGTTIPGTGHFLGPSKRRGSGSERPESTGRFVFQPTNPATLVDDQKQYQLSARGETWDVTDIQEKSAGATRGFVYQMNVRRIG